MLVQNLINKGMAAAKDIWSLFAGLGITGRFFFSRRITVHYPRAVLRKEDLESFRGPVELVGSPQDPATPKCISCMMCVSACPSGCISVTRQKLPELSPEEEKTLAEAGARGEKVKRPSAPKNPAGWTYDYTRCSLCACCIESCPTQSIRFSNETYLAGAARSDFHYDLLARLKRLAGKTAEKPDDNPSQSERRI
jgi:NADH-quinone oxidoreductase subunit I